MPADRQSQDGHEAAAVEPTDERRPARSGYTVTALSRGLRLLTAFSDQRRELRVTELAELTGLPVPTVFRLVKTLEAEGYLDQLSDGRFRPGPAVLSLGYAALQGLDVVEAASGPLRALADRTSETVNLGVLVGGNVLYLQRVKNTDLVTSTLQVGSVLPAACTSIGKLLLAFLPDAEFERRAPHLDLAACQGPNALRTMDEFRGEIARIRQQGWALQNEEIGYGIRSICAPVRDARSSVVAGMNLAVQASRWTAEDLIDTFLPPLLDAAAEASRWLGQVEPQRSEQASARAASRPRVGPPRSTSD